LLKALVERSNSPWLRDAAHHVLHDIAVGELEDLLEPIVESLEGAEAALEAPLMAKAILDRLGIRNINQPHILEPSAGSGRFLGYQPVEVASRSQRTAVELDQLTGKILRQLYPQSEVYITGFESAPLPKDSFDVAISNVPFGNYPVFDRSFKKALSLTRLESCVIL
jgi:hypothetical protein